MPDLGLLYPQRKRCARCHRYFGFEVLAGLWCSYVCAQHPAPLHVDDGLLDGDDIAEVPRECRTRSHVPGTPWWRYKRRFQSWDEAEEARLRFSARTRPQSTYLCSYCLHWHFGTSLDAYNAQRTRAS